MKAKFMNFIQGENWCGGICGDYLFEAKSFDKSSVFGIDEGRVSKLSIHHKNLGWTKSIVNFDRGWDIKPNKGKETKVFNAVMDLLENAPKRF